MAPTNNRVAKYTSDFFAIRVVEYEGSKLKVSG